MVVYLSRARDLITHQRWIWLAAVAVMLVEFSLAAFFSSVALVQADFAIKFVVPAGIPDESDILELPQLPLGELDSPGLMLMLLYMALRAFLTGGWYGGIFGLLRGETREPTSFWDDCRHYFGRCFIVGLLLLILGLVVVGLSTMLGPLFVIVWLLTIPLTFFWMMALVREDLGVGTAFQRGWETALGSFGELVGFMLLVAACTALLSIPLNLLARFPLGYLAAIVIWGYAGSVFAVSACVFYQQLREKAEGSPPLA